MAAAAGIVATTVPLVVIPLTETVYSAPEPETAATRVPPADEPANDTSAPVNPVTGLLNVTTKAIGPPVAGSGCPAALLMVTVGGGLLNVTVLSVEVDAPVGLSSASTAAEAGIVATTVPLVVIPDTETVYCSPLPVTAAASVPPAVEPV